VNDTIEWIGPGAVRDGVVEREFRLSRAAGTVPAVLWLPSAPASKQRPEQKPEAKPPLVLLGHGGSGHKRSERNLSLARWFASRAGLAALAIDGPYHGDRVSAPMPAAEYQPRIVAEGTEAVLDRMTGDWLAAVDALGAAGIADTSSVGYVGMSMGTRFGLPVAAALGGRLRCAALGKFGLRRGRACRRAWPGRSAPPATGVSSPPRPCSTSSGTTRSFPPAASWPCSSCLDHPTRNSSATADRTPRPSRRPSPDGATSSSATWPGKARRTRRSQGPFGTTEFDFHCPRLDASRPRMIAVQTVNPSRPSDTV